LITEGCFSKSAVQHLDDPLHAVEAALARDQRGEHRQAHLPRGPLAAVGVEVAAHPAPHQRAVGQERPVAGDVEQRPDDQARDVDPDRLGRRGQRETEGLEP
jgi:hypothetical protein